MREVMAAFADSSWYVCLSGGRRYHICRDDGGSRCGLPMLNETTRCPAEQVSSVLRCQRNGCRQAWPTEEVTE